MSNGSTGASAPTPKKLSTKTSPLSSGGIPCSACGSQNTDVIYEHKTIVCNTTVSYASGSMRDPLTGLPRSIKCPGCGFSPLPPHALVCNNCDWEYNYSPTGT